MKTREKEILKVRYHSGYSCKMNGSAAGTPIQIVRQLFQNRSPFLKVRTQKEYMEFLVKRLRTFHETKNSLRGKTTEAKCRSFLKIMLKTGHIKSISRNR